MKKRNLIIILIAAIIVLIGINFLISVNISNNNNLRFLNNNVPTPQIIKNSQNARPSVMPASLLNLQQISRGQIAVILDTSGKPVSAAQLEISYNPAVIKQPVVAPGTFFNNPIVLINKIDQVNGNIFFALGIHPLDTPPTGKGTIAIISFTPDNTSGSQAIFSFLGRTKITSEGISQSVLKQSTGITITLR